MYRYVIAQWAPSPAPCPSSLPRRSPPPAGSSSSYWGESFLKELQTVCDAARARQESGGLPTLLEPARLLECYRAARKRIICLDYDGTLVPHRSQPELALPSPQVLSTLARLGADPRNVLFVVSGRNRKFLTDCFGDIPGVGLAAEHGLLYRWPRRGQVPGGLGGGVGGQVSREMLLTDDWQLLPAAGAASPTWRDAVKEGGITWHYRDAEAQYGDWQAKELHLQLVNALRNMPVEVLLGNMTVEVRLMGINKGNMLLRILQVEGRRGAAGEEPPVDFVLAIGDDRTDEDMFAALAGRPLEAHAHPAPAPAPAPAAPAGEEPAASTAPAGGPGRAAKTMGIIPATIPEGAAEGAGNSDAEENKVPPEPASHPCAGAGVFTVVVKQKARAPPRPAPPRLVSGAHFFVPSVREVVRTVTMLALSQYRWNREGVPTAPLWPGSKLGAGVGEGRRALEPAPQGSLTKSASTPEGLRIAA
eukprot:tig00020941_g16242.t1